MQVMESSTNRVEVTGVKPRRLAAFSQNAVRALVLRGSSLHARQTKNLFLCRSSLTTTVIKNMPERTFFSSMYNQNCSADRTSLEVVVEQKSVAERTKMKECTTSTGLWWTRSAIWWWHGAERLLPSDQTRASIELKTWRRPSVQHSCRTLTDANTQPRISST